MVGVTAGRMSGSNFLESLPSAGVGCVNWQQPSPGFLLLSGWKMSHSRYASSWWQLLWMFPRQHPYRVKAVFLGEN